tara:strand:- start:55 stop:165 length:111 start_codon:yes stop_codon:yes gene_type:complete
MITPVINKYSEIKTKSSLNKRQQDIVDLIVTTALDK